MYLKLLFKIIYVYAFFFLYFIQLIHLCLLTLSQKEKYWLNFQNRLHFLN